MAPPYNRLKDLQDCDNTKAIVKGLVDANIQNVPRIFIRPLEDVTADGPDSNPGLEIPLIDLGELNGTARSEIVSRMGAAVRDVGFFQVVNHGIGSDVLDRMLEGARAFHKMGRDAKAEYHSRDLERLVRFLSNYDLFQSKYANWRDTLFCKMDPRELDPLELLTGCRDILMEYSRLVMALGINLFELLSEAPGLKWEYLRDWECAKGHAVLCTISLQDIIGGLDVMYRGQADIFVKFVRKHREKC